ncbi:MAG: bifunctional 4-hydroxy-3-methylbut-2-enyl diphosphate reductase/30S ribosomal protein S1 [Ruminococcaceae bacterium]|nr:bifunctional 4-hydroxy-3-methylbut-2-enyl diphosphate reductase/30S ribosomal protein S1 [Oscillospiraceae bacterium]
MEIHVAELAGFCFGVSRAVKTVERAIGGRYKTVCTLGRLIHNPGFIAGLESRGVRVITAEEIDAVCDGATRENPTVVCTRAHGIEKQLSEKLAALARKNPHFHVEDCTCPYVKKIHRIADSETDADTVMAVLGDADHPEVKGIVSWARGETVVAPTADALAEGLNNPKYSSKRIILAAQTTQNLIEWEKTLKIFEKLYTNAKIYDTICSVTENRQDEVLKLSRKMDMMIIIGGKESSNTNKLYAISKKNLNLSFLIEDASSIPLEYVKPHMKVGIAAGASTPGEIIQEVQTIMSENIEKSFEEMLDESIRTIRNGDVVKGVITAVFENEIQVAINGVKFTGIITYDELTDDPSVKLTEVYKVDDELEVKVLKVNDAEGTVQLSKKKIDVDKNWQAVVAASQNGDVLEAKIIDVVKGGVIGLCDGVRVFIPASQSGLPKDADLNELRGQDKQVKVIDINEQRKRVVASIRVVEREANKAKREAFWEQVEEGQQYRGEVKSLMSYGAFVDLGGVDGMVHSTELSWRRIKHPSEVVNVGDVIDVVVKSVDKEAKRISLTYKTADQDPWKIFTDKYQEGDVATVKIVSLMDFGAFAEVVPGADGLIHVSQITREKIAKPADVLNVGDEVEAKITKIDMDAHKISLSMKALLIEADEADAE